MWYMTDEDICEWNLAFQLPVGNEQYLCIVNNIHKSNAWYRLLVVCEVIQMQNIWKETPTASGGGRERERDC